MSGCATCGGPLPPPKPNGHRRKFCSERCRKRQYDRQCIDCGARISGTDPGKSGERCLTCTNRKNGAERKEWTRERVLDAIRAWADTHGEPPAMPDWSPTACRYLDDPERAARGQRGIDLHQHPYATTVVREFGSWNAGLVAAGFKPRLAHGGGGNLDRRRSVTA